MLFGLLAAVASTGRLGPRLLMAQDAPPRDPQLEARYHKIVSEVSDVRIAARMKALSSPAMGSRVLGYPGSGRAAQYVRDELRAAGVKDVSIEEFQTSIPRDDGAFIEAGGRRVRIYPVWPNMVRTSQLGPAGVSGSLVDIGAASLAEMANKQIDGNIVLAGFNSGYDWLNAARGGAKAIIFTEPDVAMRGEAASKFLSIPVDSPRFWASRADAAFLKSVAKKGGRVRVTCSMPWVKATGRNVLAKIEGSDPKLKSQIVILSAYLDSTSVVPSLAPGADSSAGVASLVEMAHVLQKYPPKRTVWLLATDGHFQGLAGMRYWLDKHIDKFTRPGVGERMAVWFSHLPGMKPKQFKPRDDVYLFCGLDLSSHSDGVGIFYKGYFYDFRDDLKGRFSDLASVTRENATRVATAMGWNPDVIFADGVNDIAGKNWRNYIPGKIGFDAEAVALAGGTGVTFASLNDSRALVDTPSDTFGHVKVDTVGQQVRLLACLFDHYLQDPTQTGRLAPRTFPIQEPNAFQRIGIQGGFSQVGGQAVEYNPQKSFVPNQPVGNCVAILRSASKSLMGVRANLVEVTDNKGKFVFPGVAPVTAYPGPHDTSLAAYRLDPVTGAIRYAPDQGVFGGEFNYTAFQVATSSKTMPVIVFPCVATSLYDLIDPQSLKALTGLTVLDGQTNGPPRTYGTALAVPEAMVSHVEDGAVIFTPPDTTIKIRMDAGPAATRLLLLNSKDTGKGPDSEGYGYNVGQGMTITNTAYKAARDMWILDDFRIKKLAKYRIINQGIDKLHKLAASELTMADAALKARNFEAFEAYSRSAWGFEARAYPDVQKTATDVVRGVLFYLALLLPFAFFLERLFFGWPDLYKQLTTFGLLFVIIALGFSRIHPAFDITMNPMIVILAFVMLTLSFLVIFLVAGKFEEQLRALNRQVSGVHRADIGRLSVAAAAFSLGVSNMRRRKTRTVLTCVSLILVTFIVLSFTSVVNELRFNGPHLGPCPPNAGRCTL